MIFQLGKFRNEIKNKMDDQFTIQIDNSNSPTNSTGPTDESKPNANNGKTSSFQLDDVNSTTQQEIQDNWTEPREMVILLQNTFL